jgi:cytidylate kinase
MSQPVITISRQRGSGADDIAVLVAQRLDIPLYDHQVIERAARAAGVSESVIASAERRQSFLSRMLESMSIYATPGLEAPVPSARGSSLFSTSSDYRAVVEEVLRTIADSGPGVIVGHGGGQVALRGRSDVLHVFIHAPFEQRVERMMAYARLDRENAEKDVRREDRERTAFFKDNYGLNWYDLRLYDLVIDAGRRTYEEIAEEICLVAEELAEREPGDGLGAAPRRW